MVLCFKLLKSLCSHVTSTEMQGRRDAGAINMPESAARTVCVINMSVTASETVCKSVSVCMSVNNDGWPTAASPFLMWAFLFNLHFYTTRSDTGENNN